MPRSGQGKKHQHNQRHENGLVGPGRRINKQRSNGQLNGAIKNAVSNTPPLAPTIAAEAPRRNQAINPLPLSLSDSRHEIAASIASPGLRKRSSVSSADGQSTQVSSGVQSRESDDGVRRRYETPTKASSPDVGTLQLASTILKSCPAYDTIAMLILLLQLPPIFLTLVQALFATLTFMPPTGLSMTSIFTLFDVFQGSAGTPSLGTIIAVDALCLAGWFCLWNWARNFAFDLAQVQIAITLGGGNASNLGSTNSICIAMVLVVHLVRSKSVRQFFIEHIVSGRLLAGGAITPIAQYVSTDFGFGNTQQSPSWYRSLFAIHIITQAGVAIIRRNVASTQATTTPKTSKRADTEACAGALLNQDASASETGYSASAARCAALQGPPLLVAKESKDRSTSTKKRRRQANQVRSSQPFWAALASTKVNALREIEIARPSSKSNDSPADGIPGRSLTENTQIQIVQVDSSSIKFVAANLAVEVYDQEEGLLYPRQLFVRINGAYWTSTTIYPPLTDGPGDCWSGEISGLAPNCTYTCAFLRDNDQEIAIIMVKTPALLDSDRLPLSVGSTDHRSQRSLSPTTTIRQSLVSTDARLNETKARMTKIRRAHKAAISKLEKEVDSSSARLRSSGDDTKQRQKLLQAERTIKQNEDAVQSILVAIEDLSNIPEAEVDHYSTKRDGHETQCAHLAAANDSLTSAKSSANSELAMFREDLKAISRQRERFLARQTRLNEQHERITQANLQGLNERERKAGETLAKEREHSRLEIGYSNQFSIFQRELADIAMRTREAKQEIQAIETRITFHQQKSGTVFGSPTTPEGNLPSMHFTGRPQSSVFSQALLPNHAVSGPVHRPADPAHPALFSSYSNPVSFHHDHDSKFNPMRARSASNRSAGAQSSYSADLEDTDPNPPILPGRSKLDSKGHRNRSRGSAGSIGNEIRNRENHM